ncbi:MAG: hypothetical protein ACK4NC_07060 [Candidatus Gracilibacteria bacterium]
MLEGLKETICDVLGSDVVQAQGKEIKIWFPGNVYGVFTILSSIQIYIMEEQKKESQPWILFTGRTADRKIILGLAPAYDDGEKTPYTNVIMQEEIIPPGYKWDKETTFWEAFESIEDPSVSIEEKLREFPFTQEAILELDSKEILVGTAQRVPMIIIKEEGVVVQCYIAKHNSLYNK